MNEISKKIVYLVEQAIDKQKRIDVCLSHDSTGVCVNFIPQKIYECGSYIEIYTSENHLAVSLDTNDAKKVTLDDGLRTLTVNWSEKTLEITFE